MSEEENPFIDPDVMAEDEELEEALICWKDSSRVCGPDCVAYDPMSDSDMRFFSCVLINNDRALAKSVLRLSKALMADPTTQKKEEAERLRRQLKEMDQPPPKVTT